MKGNRVFSFRSSSKPQKPFFVQPYNAGEKCRDKMVAGSNQRDAAVRAAVMKTIKALDVQQV